MELKPNRAVADPNQEEHPADDKTRQCKSGSFSCFAAAARGDECGYFGCLWRDDCPAACNDSSPKE